MIIKLTQQIIINNKHRYYTMLDELCHRSKNLYNVCLYHIRQHYKNENKYLNYYDLNRLLSSEHNVDYYNMPYAQCAQQVLRQVDKQYMSFYRALKSDKIRGKRIRLPHYKDKDNGRNVVIYTNQCFKLKDNILTLKIDKNNNISFHTDIDNIQQVRIVPRGNHIVVEIIYNKEYEIRQDNDRYAAIDLGLNNLATLTSNVCQSMIYDGKKLKSINHFYNKRKGQLRSKLCKDKYISKRIRHITYRRNNKLKDYMHKVSAMIIEYMKANNLNTLFVGKNNGWKNNINIRAHNNQNFVSIPFNMLIDMLNYKCKLAGIRMIIINEAYTSKCSAFDNEEICRRNTYMGRRVKRGLFRTATGLIINADVNGSYNIMRLGISKLNTMRLGISKFKCNRNVNIFRPTDMRYVCNPVRVKVC